MDCEKNDKEFWQIYKKFLHVTASKPQEDTSPFALNDQQKSNYERFLDDEYMNELISIAVENDWIKVVENP